MMTPKEHNNLLGILLLVYEGLQVLGLVLAIFIIFGVFGFVFTQVQGAEAAPLGLAVAIVIIALVFSGLLLIPGMIAAVKIRRERPDARGWGIAASIIALLNFPLGTALGAYGLWFLMGDVGKDYYLGGAAKNSFANPPQPPPPSSWQ